MTTVSQDFIRKKCLAGDASECKSISTRCFPTHVADKKDCLVHFNGHWYDIADYMDKHPGGDIIKEYVGKDVTVMMRVWHPTHVFNNIERFVPKVDVVLRDNIEDEQDSAEASTRAGSEDGEDSSTTVSNSFETTSENKSLSRSENKTSAPSSDVEDSENNSFQTTSENKTSSRSDKRLEFPNSSLIAERQKTRENSYPVTSWSCKSSADKFKAVADYTSLARTELTTTERNYLDLYAKMEKLGYFRGSTFYLYSRWAMVFAFFLSSCFCFNAHLLRGVFGPDLLLFLHIVGAFCLYQVWAQCAGIFHDCCHNQYFNGSIKRNAPHLFYSASVGFGVSSAWWKWEHVEHHSFTNSFDKRLKCATDPQTTEDVWYQDDAHLLTYDGSFLRKLVLRLQAGMFFFGCVVLGRMGICLDSFSLERRLKEFLGLATHWTWTCLLFRSLFVEYGWRYALGVYAVAGLFEGLLHLQLMVNHNERPWFEKHGESVGELLENSGYTNTDLIPCAPHPKTEALTFVDKQLRQVLNISCPVWMDWWWGGLNFHAEHHLFPRMAREHARKVHVLVKQFAKENSLPYNQSTFSAGLLSCARKLLFIKRKHL